MLKRGVKAYEEKRQTRERTILGRVNSTEPAELQVEKEICRFEKLKED